MKLSIILLLASLARFCHSQTYTYPNVTDVLSICPGKTPLYFGLIMSFDPQQFDGSGAIAGVNVALDRINSNCSLLPGYSLHYTVADSKCTRTGGLDALFEKTLFEPPTPKIAVIGSGCSPATEPTAEVSHYYNITHLSCVSSSPALEDRNRFRRYFQLLNSEDSLAYAYYGVIKQYGWQHVSLIVQDENLFTSTINTLKELLNNDSIMYDERLFSTNGGVADLGAEPFNLERRIHLIASYSMPARQLICQAFTSGVHLPRHVLLTPAWYNANWWRVEDNSTTCTVEQREMVLKNSLAFLHFNFLDRNGTDDVITTDGLTDDEYLEQETSSFNVPPLNLTESPYAPFCYDATWTLLYALQETLVDIQDEVTNQNLSSAYGLGSEEFKLSNFTYSSDALVNIIFRHLTNTSFNGITGAVQFGDNGIREVTKLIIYQFRENSSGLINWVEIGQVTSNFSTYTFSGESDEMVWPNGVPYDGIPLNATATIHPAVTAIYFILTTAGIVFATFCLAFNFIFKNRKLIKLTSPNLNLLIGVGAIILYFNLYLFVFPVNDPTTVAVLCNLTPWFTAIGYSLCYGTIVVKMTRVYYIFNSPSPKKVKVPDWKLFLGVLSLVVVDVIILVVYTVVEGSTYYPDGLTGLHARKVINTENTEDVQGEVGQIIKYFVFVCNVRARDIMLGVLYGYKALLQIIALIFSFSIRKVKVKGLDDAIFIAASIYVSSIVLAIILVSTFTLNDFLNVFPVVFCTGFLIGTTVILGLVFIPLMVGLYKDPTGETIFDKSLKSGGTTTINNNLQTQTVEGLKMRVTELEAIVASTGGTNGIYRSQNVDTSVSLPTQTPPMTPKERQENILLEMVGEIPRERTNTIWDSEEEESYSQQKQNQPNENGKNHTNT